MQRWAWVVVLLGLAGCDDNLPVASLVDKIRVLAVRAEPPEVTPGNQATLSALVVEPDRSTVTMAPVSYLWLACKEQPSATFEIPCGLRDGELDGTKLPPQCTDPVDGTLCVLGKDTIATLSPAANLAAGTLIVTLVVADTDAGAEDCLLSTARNHALPTEPDRCVLAVKRLTVGAGVGIPNHNPMLDRLDLVDTDGTVRSLLQPGVVLAPSADASNLDERDLRVQRNEASAEQRSDGTYEAMSLSWFTTTGQYKGARSTFDPPGCDSQTACASVPPVTTAVTQWLAPDAARVSTEAASDGTMHIWAVLRDDRGGVGWLTGSLQVR